MIADNVSPQVCTRCVMDTTYAETTFDENGVCNHCISYFARIADELPPLKLRSKRLDEIVEEIKQKGRGKPYDCLIGVSGGVDSTMVAWLCKQHGLRPLAVHFDNGWNSELAVENVKRTLDVLQIDLVTHVVDWPEFRDLQLSFIKAGVQNLEMPTDHAISALLFRTAAKHGIKSIITGGNVITEGIHPVGAGHYNQDLKHLRAIHRLFGTKKLRTTPTISLAQFAYYLLVKRIKFIPVLSYIDYDKAKTIELLVRELGWRPYPAKHFESIYTRVFQGYVQPRKFNVDKRKMHFSCLVCAGMMSRQDALAQLQNDPYHGLDLESDLEFTLKKLGMSRAEFDAYLAAPPKRHTDYPSNYYLFHELRWLRNLVKRLAGNAEKDQSTAGDQSAGQVG